MTRDQLDEIGELFDQADEAKTFTELLAEGVKHRGGLAQLAQAEQVALARVAKAKNQLH